MIGIGRWCGLATLTLLAGCGGGGGDVASTGTPPSTTTTDPVVTTPTPVAATPTPTPAPTPTPTIVYDDAEYQRSNAAQAASAVSAYNAGASGAGIKIAVLDSGVSQVGTEFGGRIDPASRDFGGSGTYADADGHGTAVAAVAAAGRNGANIEGVAWGATILALRADTAGSCAATDGCDFSTNTLATAIDYARTNNARVINLSLGGAASTATLNAAINRATAAGIIVVIAAGNDSAADPDALAQVASSSSARGLVIIAGSHDANGALSSFSNKAGGYAAYYLAALGSRVRAFDNTGAAFLFSGTSFSTPAIAGAVALLAQAYPSLTAAQLVTLLYATATDAGATGVDTTYGHGLLNLARAFQPFGATTLAGSAIAIGATDTSQLSAAMGDASLATAGLGQAIVLDSLGRAYAMNLARAGVAAQARPLRQTLGLALASTHATAGAFDLTGTVARGIAGEPWAGFAQRGRGLHADLAARPVEASLVGKLDARTSVGFAWNGGGGALDDRLAGFVDSASFVAARAPGDTLAPGAGRRASVVARRRVGAFDVSAFAEQGALPALGKADPATATYTLAAARITRAAGPIALRIGFGTIDEARTIVGARFAPAFGGGGAQTRFVDAGARAALGGGWSLAAQWRAGWTRAEAGGLLDGGTLATRAAAFDLGRAGATTRFGLRFALPQRVSGGGLRVHLPSDYDYATGTVGYTTSRVDLVPQGRERDFEAAWGAALGGGWLDANLFLRREPGNIAAAPDDRGAALRFSLAL